MLAEMDPVLSIFLLYHCPAYSPVAHSTLSSWMILYLTSLLIQVARSRETVSFSQQLIRSNFPAWTFFWDILPMWYFVKHLPEIICESSGLYFTSLLKTHLYQDACTVAFLLLIAKWVVCWESLKFLLFCINYPALKNKNKNSRSETCYYPTTSIPVLTEPWTGAPQDCSVG